MITSLRCFVLGTFLSFALAFTTYIDDTNTTAWTFNGDTNISTWQYVTPQNCPTGKGCIGLVDGSQTYNKTFHESRANGENLNQLLYGSLLVRGKSVSIYGVSSYISGSVTFTGPQSKQETWDSHGTGPMAGIYNVEYATFDGLNENEDTVISFQVTGWVVFDYAIVNASDPVQPSPTPTPPPAPIVGGVVGGCVGLAFIASLVIWWILRRRAASKRAVTASGTIESPAEEKSASPPPYSSPLSSSEMEQGGSSIVPASPTVSQNRQERISQLEAELNTLRQSELGMSPQERLTALEQEVREIRRVQNAIPEIY
ncbi:hypothetical protein DL96DRAFT_1748214 [Flagelloscypha sp. PMI_526]|nr:hypothetical protein DL96DRAFT_1748214 [Flagelloscypha sp. PMI_526]